MSQHIQQAAHKATSQQSDKSRLAVQERKGSKVMRLIGMLDSPYVRRVAISLKYMGLAFDHEPVSVFRDYDTFARSIRS